MDGRYLTRMEIWIIIYKCESKGKQAKIYMVVILPHRTLLWWWRVLVHLLCDSIYCFIFIVAHVNVVWNDAEYRYRYSECEQVTFENIILVVFWWTTVSFMIKEAFIFYSFIAFNKQKQTVLLSSCAIYTLEAEEVILTLESRTKSLFRRCSCTCDRWHLPVNVYCFYQR